MKQMSPFVRCAVNAAALGWIPGLFLGSAFNLLFYAVLTWVVVGYAFRHQVRFLNSSQSVEGRFLEWRAVRMGNGVCWYPAVSFVTPDGQIREVLGNTGTSPKPKHPPKRLIVRYAANDFSKAQIYSFFHFWYGILVGLIAAILLTFATLDSAKLLHL